MKNIISLFLLLLLAACGGGDNKPSALPVTPQKNPTPDLTGKMYIISGQSNAENCDWLYFEKLTGATTIMTAKGSHTIDMLIANYNHPELTGTNPEAIIFVHGESDAIAKTDPDYYTSQVEALRLMISAQTGKDLPLLISTVGYISGRSPIWYDKIRGIVKDYISDNWIIAFDNAQYFQEWGMRLDDGVHFNTKGCQTMMNGISDSIWEISM